MGEDLNRCWTGVFLALQPSAHIFQPFGAAGVPDLFVAQMIGHSSPSILRIYSRVDEFRRDAVRKLEALRAENSSDAETVANVPIN